MPTKEELIAQLSSEYGVDVAALSAQAELGVALSTAITEAFEGNADVIALSADSAPTQDQLVGAISKASEQIVSLSADIATRDQAIKDKEAEAEVEKLVLTGYILPKDKDAMLELRKEKPALFQKFVPEAPVIKLSQENGEEPPEPEPQDVNAEVERLVALSNSVTASTN